jgi:hypothetical protein
MKDFTTAVIRDSAKGYEIWAREDEKLPLRKIATRRDIRVARKLAAERATFVYDHTRRS